MDDALRCAWWQGSVSIDMRRARALAGNTWPARQNSGCSDRQTMSVRSTELYAACSTPEGEEWLERVPVPQVSRCGHLSEVTEARRELRRRLVFFNVNNLEPGMTRLTLFYEAETQFRTSRLCFPTKAPFRYGYDKVKLKLPGVDQNHGIQTSYAEETG